jgi:translation initiation factor IF-3
LLTKKSDDRNFVRRNEQIRIPRVLIVKEGVRLGVYPTYEAIRMARDEGLDLVEIAPNERPPVCSIMDYGRYKYDQQKKQKERKTNIQKEKEASFRYVINDHDLLTKTNQIKGWLEEGDRVKITIKFKARENAHREQGMVTIKKCLEKLADISNVEREPGFEGNQIVCRLLPKKKDEKVKKIDQV